MFIVSLYRFSLAKLSEQYLCQQNMEIYFLTEENFWTLTFCKEEGSKMFRWSFAFGLVFILGSFISEEMINQASLKFTCLSWTECSVSDIDCKNKLLIHNLLQRHSNDSVGWLHICC